MKDDAITAGIRRSIIKSIVVYYLNSLKRIVDEVKCEQMGIYPDMTYMEIPE